MIATIDMHLRDFRLLEWLAKHDNQRIPSSKISQAMHCHRNTVYAMVKRLESAGYIQIERSQRRGGNVYKVKSVEEKCS